MQKWRQWENADQDAWQLALEREDVIRPLAEQGRLSPTLVQDATRQLRLSRSVLYDLLRRYKQRPAAADFFTSAMEERPCTCCRALHFLPLRNEANTIPQPGL